MKWSGTRNIGMVLLGIWLVASGALAFVNAPIANAHAILSGLALAAGVFILLGK